MMILIGDNDPVEIESWQTKIAGHFLQVEYVTKGTGVIAFTRSDVYVMDTHVEGLMTAAPVLQLHEEHDPDMVTAMIDCPVCEGRGLAVGLIDAPIDEPPVCPNCDGMAQIINPEAETIHDVEE